jgi:AcrR family transcriptional regulator
MRRAPQRARGQQRVSAILDVAEDLLAEAGYEGMSTNEIAARAGIPIGSIYQYFPNKEAILHAAAARFRQGFAELYDTLLVDGLVARPLPELVDKLIGAIVEYGGQHFGVTRVILQGQANPHVAAAAVGVQRDLLELVEAQLEARASHLPAARRSLVASVGITAVLALLSHAITLKQSAGHEEMLRIVQEAKRLLLAYLRAAVTSDEVALS